MLDLSSPFPLLQQTEHPTTGQVVWSVHPCRVAEAVEEVLADESGAGSVTETERNTNANANAVADPNKYPKTERKTETKTERKTETKTDTDTEMGTGTLGSDTRGGDGDGLSGMEVPKRASESMSASTSAPEHSVRWLETWMMLSSTIVDLTYP
jgi:metal transporter CNNM